MKYETFDQPAYDVGDLETFGITDNSGSLVMDFTSDSGMESWRADSLLNEDLQAYTQVSRAHEMDGDGGTIPPPPPPPPGGSDDDDTSTDDSSGDTSGSGDTGSGDDDEDTVVIEQGYDPTAELKEALLNQDSPDFVYNTEFGKLLEDYSSKLDPSAIASNQESSRDEYWNAYQKAMEDEYMTFSDKVIKSMNEHTNEQYVAGSADCDIWAKDRLDDAGMENNPIVNPKDTDISSHSDNMKGGQDTVSEGVNIHIKDDHMSVVVKQGDTYTVGHQGYNTQEVELDSGVTNDYSNTYTYYSEESFKKSNWGDGTYYSVEGN